MSSVFKGIKKIFKKVVKVVKKVAPVVLGIGALVFTGGAALGLAPAMGGWGAAASAITAKLGAGGVLGSALTGAITQAGYGALIGGTVAELSGGNFAEGMRKGAAGGAVTGGLLGAYSGLRAPTGAPGQATTTPLPPEATALPGKPQAIDASGNVVANTPTGVDPTAPVTNTGGDGGLLSRVSGAFEEGGWVERNQRLVGDTVRGLGQGLLAGADADAERDLLREQHRLTSENYAGTDPGRNFRSAAPGRSGQTPTERFDPKTYGSFEYVYDPQQQRIVRQPVGQA